MIPWNIGNDDQRHNYSVEKAAFLFAEMRTWQMRRSQHPGIMSGTLPKDTPHVTTADVRSSLPTIRLSLARDDYIADSFVEAVNKRYDVAALVQDGVEGKRTSLCP